MKTIVVVILMAVAAMPAGAQASADSARARALEAFQPGDRIRAALLSNRWTGSFERVTGDTLFFGTRGDIPMALRFSAIDSLWRGADARRRGAWIGGLTGVALGAYAGLVVIGLAGAEYGQPKYITGDMVKGGVFGALGLGLVGLLTGEFIGKRIRTWRLVYP